jgi:2,3-bisphosphoglycerate-independent phosphoglycerate mutase
MSQVQHQVALIVLDGWGHREDTTNNAIASSQKPFFDSLWTKYPHTLLEASGPFVGLPSGQMGNSEIGHTTIGAGTVIDTDLVRIAKAIENGDFAKNPAVVATFNQVKKNNSTLHVMGLIGDGGVHAHSNHLIAFIKAAKAAGVQKLAIHAFMDGRDTLPQSGVGYLKELESAIKEIGLGFIATVSGRYYAMDRDKNWDRITLAEDAIFEGKAPFICEENPSAHLQSLYATKVIDELLIPFVCKTTVGVGAPIQKGDAIFFTNFRADRARELSERIIAKRDELELCFATLAEYKSEYNTLVAFPPLAPKTTIAKEVSNAGFTQAHLAETEKFPHATYFLNGGVEKPYPGEKHILLASRKDVKTHDEAPEMRAEAIADKAIEEIEAGTNFIFINFANADMVGHTANVPAIIKAVETADKNLERVVTALTKRGGVAFVTADHGNAELNIDPETGEKHTSHTLNLVPAIITLPNVFLRAEGGLADIAPTILELIGLQKPEAMTGVSLIEEWK